MEWSAVFLSGTPFDPRILFPGGNSAADMAFRFVAVKDGLYLCVHHRIDPFQTVGYIFMYGRNEMERSLQQIFCIRAANL